MTERPSSERDVGFLLSPSHILIGREERLYQLAHELHPVFGVWAGRRVDRRLKAVGIPTGVEFAPLTFAAASLVQLAKEGRFAHRAAKVLGIGKQPLGQEDAGNRGRRVDAANEFGVAAQECPASMFRAPIMW